MCATALVGSALTSSATPSVPTVRALPAARQAPAVGLPSTLAGAGGFRVKVPAGYSLKVKNAVYTVSGPAGRIVLEQVTTTQTATRVGVAILRLAKGTARPQIATTAHFLGVYPSKGQTRTLEVTRHGRALLLAVYQPTTTAARSFATRVDAKPAVTSSTLALLRQIAATAAGGRAITPASPLPLHPFTNADGSATAQVLDGWFNGGKNGIVEGTDGANGLFAFGVSFPVTSPSSSLANYPGTVTAPFTTPAQSMSATLPAFFRNAGLRLDSVTVTGTFPGSDQVLGAPFQSGFFTVQGVTAGHLLNGVVLFGGAPDPRFDDGSWIAYTSYVFVRPGADPRLGAALLASWGSWNPSVDQSRRTASTLHTILTTYTGGAGPIDPAVFEAASADWDDYLRN